MSKLKRHFKWITRKYKKMNTAIEHIKRVPEDLEARKKITMFIKQLEEDEGKILTYLLSSNSEKRKEAKIHEEVVTSLIKECKKLI